MTIPKRWNVSNVCRREERKRERERKRVDGGRTSGRKLPSVTVSLLGAELLAAFTRRQPFHVRSVDTQVHRYASFSRGRHFSSIFSERFSLLPREEVYTLSIQILRLGQILRDSEIWLRMAAWKLFNLTVRFEI